MTDILVVNHGLHHVCGIHDLGRRLYEAIPDNITKAYAEPANPGEYEAAVEAAAPRVVLVNYRADLMPWARGADAFSVAVAHNYEPPTLAALAHQHRSAGFDVTLALEPQCADTADVVWSGRPLPPPLRWAGEGASVTIGSFGFAFPHKRFDLVAREVATLDDAMFRLHCPTAHFGGSPAQTEAVAASVMAELPDPRRVTITTDHRPALEVVRLLSQCTANALLYEPGQPDAGLSSALDYLLAAGRPILVSEASMFRHALPAAVTWPTRTLADVLADLDRHTVNVRERYDQLSAGYVSGIRQLLDMA